MVPPRARSGTVVSSIARKCMFTCTRGAVKACACQHMAQGQLMDRDKGHTGMADQIGQGRQAEIDTLKRNAPGLAVQRLMLYVFVEGHHRDQLRPGPATRDDMERCWGLADLLASPAGELLAHNSDLRRAGSPSTGAG